MLAQWPWPRVISNLQVIEALMHHVRLRRLARNNAEAVYVGGRASNKIAGYDWCAAFEKRKHAWSASRAYQVALRAGSWKRMQNAGNTVNTE